MKYTYLLLFVFMIASCNNTITNASSECKEYIQTVKKKWPEKTDGFYPLTDYETIWGKDQSCLYGTSKKEIKKIFGKPSTTAKHKLHYYLKKECALSIDQREGCVILTFVFDDKDDLIFIQTPIIETSVQ